ncbi:MAG: hypothetical protein KJ893_03365 [Candidatus Omnitrophica bacterium]|nr:hypothetical protein [Candidatus Omnitrophota bacterium]MBU4478512.1 hypothetical protein [Candidatus Omnitrophota bacterium]MCG2703693.1 hypothetical protein [Candidatus Omnitrophota bacterium]
MKIIEKTCAFFTFGCKVNQYETQLIREAFLKKGFVETRKNPAYCIVNGCSVTLNADRKCRLLIRSLRKKNPQAKIIVTGCYAQNRFDSAQLRKAADYVVSQDKKAFLMPEQVDAKTKAFRKYRAEAAAKEVSFLRRMKLLHKRVNVIFEGKADGWWRGYSKIT